MDIESFYKIIGSRVKQQRTFRKMSQDVLASKLKVKRTSITNLESGKQRIPIHLLHQICEYLKIDIHQIIPNNSSKWDNSNIETFPIESAKSLTHKVSTKTKSVIDKFLNPEEQLPEKTSLALKNLANMEDEHASFTG